MNDKSNRLFTISQAAKACDISRSTLLRMEERGLIHPAHTNPKSGRIIWRVILPKNRLRTPAVSLLYYGSYERLEAPYLLMGEETKKRGLKPAGYVRSIGIVGPATGRNIEEKRYCSRRTVFSSL